MGTGTDTRSDQALRTLRKTVIPRALGDVAGARTYVGAIRAASMDLTATMDAHLPIVFVFVLGLALVLLDFDAR